MHRFASDQRYANLLAPRRKRVLYATLTVAVTGLGTSCVGETPPSDLDPPDPVRVMLYFPIGGTVYGRGLRGAVADPRAKFVCTREPFASFSDCNISVQSDGSFDFSIRAVSDDALELATAEDPAGKVRGAFSFVRVPKTPSPRPAMGCCRDPAQSSGICQTRQSIEAGDPCGSVVPNVSRQCASDRECGADSHETLELDASRISVTPPSTEGHVEVEGQVSVPGALVRLENRGQRTVFTRGERGRDPRSRFSRVADEEGRFRFGRVSARAGDELVLQYLTLNDDRSPEASFSVPAPRLAGMDIIAIENFDALTEGEVGAIAVKLSPYGIDGYGLCPTSSDGPLLCFGGGLTHSMIQIERATIDGISVPISPAAIDENRPNNRGTHGDPLRGALTIMLVVDMSAKAGTLDPRGDRLAWLRRFVGIRTRDRVGVVAYGPSPPLVIAPSSDDQRGVIFEALEGMTTAGPPDVFGAIRIAGDTLASAGAQQDGHVVVVSLDAPQAPAGTTLESAFEQAWRSVGEDPATGFEGFPVNILTAHQPQPNSLLGDIAAFTGGLIYPDAACAAQLEESLPQLAAEIFGAFVLLYDVRVPEERGKSARIGIDAEIRIGEAPNDVQTAAARFEGPLLVANASQNEVPICQ